MLSFIHEPSDIFLVKTSYIYRPEENTFILVLHIPLVSPHNLMRHSKSYQVISLMDVQACIKMGETYFCKEMNVLLTDLTKTCLRATDLTSDRSIQWRCKFSISRAQEKIFYSDSNMYVVYSLGKISSKHVCPKVKTISVVQISSGQTVRIKASCFIWTMDHIITADDSKEIEIHSKWLDWTWTLRQLFQQPENEVVTAAIEKLCTKNSGKFYAEVLLHDLKTMDKENTGPSRP